MVLQKLTLPTKGATSKLNKFRNYVGSCERERERTGQSLLMRKTSRIRVGNPLPSRTFQASNNK